MFYQIRPQLKGWLADEGVFWHPGPRVHLWCVLIENVFYFLFLWYFLCFCLSPCVVCVFYGVSESVEFNALADTI